ncbi:DUF402 domain-containing protein [Sporolactobacillus vineae]|uniref:DUF402 domain-containing protein n=1 Tax=Sporolactobacillus vineae TaxID=444463 RepID=UPI0002899C16|nr:DUF402 domain-containing protein [Sporolactobacillus vineae]
MIERKIRYDGTTADFECRVVRMEKEAAVLSYVMPETVSVGSASAGMNIPAGSVTFAYYWAERPYNVYIWRNRQGTWLGAYFNIVRNTRITSTMISYEDLIVDLILTPAGLTLICDEEELPESLATFEKGTVLKTLNELRTGWRDLLAPIISETEKFRP